MSGSIHPRADELHAAFDATEDEEEDDDEPFPMWDGVIAFEDGEADAPPAGVIVVDGFCDYLGKRCAQVLEEAGYAVVQANSTISGIESRFPSYSGYSWVLFQCIGMTLNVWCP